MCDVIDVVLQLPPIIIIIIIIIIPIAPSLALWDFADSDSDLNLNLTTFMIPSFHPLHPFLSRFNSIHPSSPCIARLVSPVHPDGGSTGQGVVWRHSSTTTTPDTLNSSSHPNSIRRVNSSCIISLSPFILSSNRKTRCRVRVLLLSRRG